MNRVTRKARIALRVAVSLTGAFAAISGLADQAIAAESDLPSDVAEVAAQEVAGDLEIGGAPAGVPELPQKGLDAAIQPMADESASATDGAGLVPADTLVVPYVGSVSLNFPLNSMYITSNYGSRYQPILHYTRMHEGTDFRAPCGTDVLAAQSGTVVSAERSGTAGNVVTIDHGASDGKKLTTRYLHLSKMLVKPGAAVAQGDLVGLSGMTGGVSTGCHLHFEVLLDGVTVDPVTQLPTIEPPVIEAPPVAESEETGMPIEPVVSITENLSATSELALAEETVSESVTVPETEEASVAQSPEQPS